MTFNMRSGLGRDGQYQIGRIAEIIQNESPDVVALQEVDVKRSYSGNVDQPHALGEKLGMNSFFSPRLRKHGGEYGLAILSRFPMRIRKTAPIVRASVNSKGEKSIAVWISFDFDGKEIHLINTHMVHSFTKRWESVKTILGKDWIGGLPSESPVIFCGDFNSMPFSLVIRKIRKKLFDVVRLDPSRGHGSQGFVTTWSTPRPFARIDYIFTSSHFHVEKTYSSRKPPVLSASDHTPVLAYLALKEIS